MPLTPNLTPRLVRPCATDGANTLVQNVEANLSSNRQQRGFRITDSVSVGLHVHVSVRAPVRAGAFPVLRPEPHMSASSSSLKYTVRVSKREN